MENSYVEVPLPTSFSLNQNYPNPFNPTTQITYNILQTVNVTLTIYDIAGQAVMTLVNEYQGAGTYNISFDASRLNSGVYFYRIHIGEFTDAKKMVFTK